MTVTEKQVKFIVNLTSLEDKGGYGYYDDGESEKEEYWPSEEIKDLANGLKIELLNTEKQGSVRKRYSVVLENWTLKDKLYSFLGNCACLKMANSLGILSRSRQ